MTRSVTKSSSPGAPTVHLASSSGGHIDLLYALSSAFDGYQRVWVVQPSLRADTLAAAGETVHLLPQYDRHPIRGHFLSNFIHAAWRVVRERPRLVVTTGAGITVPFCLLARLTGAKILFVETMARVMGPSASGRVLTRLSARTIVQWSEALPSYRRGRLCRPALLNDVAGAECASGSGTFVGVGTHSQQFDRLLAMVDEAVGDGVLPRPVVAQGGVSRYRPDNYTLRDWLQPDEVETAIRGAKYVVCHGGSGIVASALRAGRRPLVLPRRAAYGEHFDNHQAQIVNKLATLGFVVRLGPTITINDLRMADGPLPTLNGLRDLPPLESVLFEELEEALGLPLTHVQTADPGRGRPNRLEAFNAR